MIRCDGSSGESAEDVSRQVGAESSWHAMPVLDSGAGVCRLLTVQKHQPIPSPMRWDMPSSSGIFVDAVLFCSTWFPSGTVSVPQGPRPNAPFANRCAHAVGDDNQYRPAPYVIIIFVPPRLSKSYHAGLGCLPVCLYHGYSRPINTRPKLFLELSCAPPAPRSIRLYTVKDVLSHHLCAPAM